MKRTIILLALFTTAVCALGPSKAYTESNEMERILPLIPWPQKVERGAGSYSLQPGSSMAIASDAADVASMLANDVKIRFGVEVGSTQPDSNLKGFSIMFGDAAEPANIPDGSESYSLSVSDDGIILAAHDRAGLYWATRTLLQLARKDGDGVSFPAVTISDRPRFERRALLVDPARNFISIGGLKRYVDLISDLKYNVLHLHFTDDQGWRFESKIFPKLQEVGGKDGYYTQEQLRDLVAYAAERGVEVMPEIDMPGHATALLAAYPELSCTGKPVKLSRHFGILPYAMCPAKEEVYVFIEKLLAESAGIFPSKFIHIGSDEVKAYDWSKCEACRKLAREKSLEGNEGLHAYFLGRVNEIIKSLGRRTVAWDETARFAPEDVVIQAWRSIKWAEISAGQGMTTLCSPIQTTYVNYSRVILPLKKCYLFDPIPESLDPDKRKFIIGGGANMWGNYLTSEKDIDRYLFPRLIAIAEVYWSPRDARDYDDFTARLPFIRHELEVRGVEFGDPGFTVAKDTFRIAGRLIEAGAYFAADKIRH